MPRRRTSTIGSVSSSVRPPALASGDWFDLVVIFEALHEMSRPVGLVRAANDLISSDGDVIMVDERAADAFIDGAGQSDRAVAGSTTVCLPNSLAEQHRQRSARSSAHRKSRASRARPGSPRAVRSPRRTDLIASFRTTDVGPCNCENAPVVLAQFRLRDLPNRN